MTAPTFTSLTAVASPSPGVQVVINTTDVAANTYRLWRLSPTGQRTVVRGADNATIITSVSVTDYEADIGVPVTYIAVTYSSLMVPSAESAVSSPITLTSTRCWLSNPLVPSQAIQVTIGEFMNQRKRTLDFALLDILGSNQSLMIAGTRKLGSGNVVFTALVSDDVEAIRAILTTTAVVLLRGLDGYDIGTAFLGIGDMTEGRIGPITEPTRFFNCDATFVARPAAAISGALYDYLDLFNHGYIYSNLSSPAGLTYLQLGQRGGL